ncbi:response regulator [Nitrospira moscoviensis]|uniref:Response regulator receiver protein n=1 Tax=Nitrospira moscoviensis TaxID=42253 RepID=A0A0K2GDQ9_NITMO|nr:response regulator [Nitrospira moscoviensis]ALA59091.1 Response regulator receiver protein [Nitrospira moscoviensis]
MTNGMEILLIEDNPEDVELTLRAFRKYHLANRIQVVRDGEEALECLFSTGRYAGSGECANTRLILLDLKLPKVDGLEILQKCKSDPRTRNIPVVVLTSSREEQDLIKSYNLGVNSYVVKPVDFPQFTDAVRQLGLYWMLLNQVPAEWRAEGGQGGGG